MHIYIHIPFCKKACHYCDFHFSTNLKNKENLVKALVQEIELRQDFLPSKSIETVYFGGGSPSLLTESELSLIFDKLHTTFDLSKVKEVSLEANPDDMHLGNLKSWKNIGINRLSVGVQSFDEKTLAFMNRAHNAEQSQQALIDANTIFGDNISVDIIFGRNAAVFDAAEQDRLLETDFSNLEKYAFNHLSAYGLTIEPNTSFYKWQKTGMLNAIPEDYSANQYEKTISMAASLGFEHYEISNFAKNQNYALHNTAYWQNKPYLGLGPAAHSFKDNVRYNAIANNTKYIKSITENILPLNTEILSNDELFNEALLCGLRTKWGVNLEKLADIKALNLEFDHTLGSFIAKGLIIKEHNIIKISDSGKILADSITSDLMY